MCPSKHRFDRTISPAPARKLFETLQWERKGKLCFSLNKTCLQYFCTVLYVHIQHIYFFSPSFCYFLFLLYTGPKNSYWRVVKLNTLPTLKLWEQKIRKCNFLKEGVLLYYEVWDIFVLHSYVGINSVECVPLFLPAFAVLFFAAHWNLVKSHYFQPGNVM